MSVSSILGGFASYSRLVGSNDDDWADRLNHIYTVVLLAIFAIFVSSGQYIGDPIQCWCPAQFTGSYVSYTKSYCWIKNTYYIPMSDIIPVAHAEREEQEINYYQWVPIILLFMAFLFKFPSLVWRIFNGGSGLNLDKLVNMTTSTQVGDPGKRDETVNFIALYVDKWLEANREYKWNIMVRMRQRASRFCCLCNKREGTYLTGFYMFIKILFVINVICQFFILNAFLGDWFHLYGFEVLEYLSTNQALKESPRFPRVTLCDFEIRQLQNIQRFSVQCVLPINLFNEKIFIFLWFWMAFVAAATAGNLLFWVYRTLFRLNRAMFIKKYLKISDELHGEEDKKLAKKFADQYLRDDGLFVLRIVGKNSNDILLTDLIVKLWRIYKDKPLIRKSLSEDYNESMA